MLTQQTYEQRIQSLIQKILRTDGYNITNLTLSEKDLLSEYLLEHEPRHELALNLKKDPTNDLNQHDITSLARDISVWLDDESTMYHLG